MRHLVTVAALVLLLVTAATANAAVTTRYFSSYDIATNGTSANAGQFTGGVGGTAPIFRTNATQAGASDAAGVLYSATTRLFPPTATNRTMLDFDLSASGTTGYGIIPFGATASQSSASVQLIPMLGPIAVCVRGTFAGYRCADDSQCGGGGYCQAQRTPLITMSDGSANAGCMLTISQSCESVQGSPAAVRKCVNGSAHFELLYGSRQLAPAGRCQSSSSMDDTPCGGVCTTTTKATDCLQGRYALPNSRPTNCVADSDGLTDCTAGGAEGCHCINECDENNIDEASCEPGVYSGLTYAHGVPYVLGVEQVNGGASRPGDVQCILKTGTIDASTGASSVFGRGSLGVHKVGICGGGSAISAGGNNGKACGADSDCVTGTCTVTNRITPSQVILGPDAAVKPYRVLMDNVLLQTGANTTTTGSDVVTKNYRSETLLVSGNYGTQNWTSTGGTSSQCLMGNGTPANEPDGNTTRLSQATINTANWTHEWDFADPATTSDTPLAVAMSASAQDNDNRASEGIFAQLSLFNTGVTTGAAFDFDTFHPDDGNSANYYPMPRLLVVVDPADGTTALTTTIIAGLHGRIQKYDNGVRSTNREGRITTADMEVVYATADPSPPSVLPGNNRVAFLGDSRTNEALLYQNLIALLTEPSAIYEDGKGGAALGDWVADFSTLMSGGNVSGGMTTNAVFGTAGQTVDVAVIDAGGINTLHNYGITDPITPTAYEGLAQGGYCEDWTSGGGYGPRQGLPCHCEEDNNWNTASRSFTPFRSICLYKNANFGNVGGTCTCSANSECTMGTPAAAVNGTCTSSSCVSTPTDNPVLVASASPTNRSWKGIGCTPATGAVGCPGVCLSGNSSARMMRGVEQITATAAALASPPSLVWVTTPLANAAAEAAGKSNGSDAVQGWYDAQPRTRLWNAALLTWARARGKNWVDLDGYFLEQCGTDLIWTKNATATGCLREGIHYSPHGHELAAKLFAACLSNTDLDGNTGKTTDGVCGIGAGLCVGATHKCASGLLLGQACTSDDQCDYCTSGAAHMIGARCSTNEQCGRYRCVF